MPKPAWRTRRNPRRVAIAVGLTVGCYVAIGLILLILFGRLLDKVGAPGWAGYVMWLVPIIGTVIWVVARPAPATVSEYESQPWSTYAIRRVMVGSEQARPRPQRIATAIVLGAPLFIFMVVFAVLDGIAELF